MIKFIFAAAMSLLSLHCLANGALLESESALDFRVSQLAGKLRCLVCQNQTLADSDAELARDLKSQIKEQLRQGKSEGQITRYLTERYGDFVLYQPPLKSTTWFLWFGPFLMLLVGMVLLFSKLKQQRKILLAVSDADAQLLRTSTLLEKSEE